MYRGWVKVRVEVLTGVASQVDLVEGSVDEDVYGPENTTNGHQVEHQGA